jgi:hypothetical protein
MLAVTRLMVESSNNNWMNRIDDPRRLGTNLAFGAMTIVCMGICSAHGNKDAHEAGEPHSSQHYGKISRTVHYVLHLFVRRILADQTTPGLGSDDNGLDYADAAAIDDANRQDRRIALFAAIRPAAISAKIVVSSPNVAIG